jgi:hypothetical protein
MKTRSTALVLALATLFSGVLLPVSASAAGWGKGTFSGKVRGQFGPRPKTNVVLSARGRKVRIVKLGLVLDCSDGNQFGLPAHWRTLVAGKSVRVREGAAGGGAILRFKVTKRYRGKPVPVRVEAFLGLRSNYIQGTIDAEVSRGWNPQDCSDSGIFTARR